MDGETMKLLSEYIAEQNRRNRERNTKCGYEKVYLQDTNGIEQDDTDTFWPPDND